MRRTAVAAPRDATRRDRNGRSSGGGGGPITTTSSGVAAAAPASGAAALRAWLQPRLLYMTTQLLTLQPHDPLRVLATAFTMEGLLLTASPDAPSAADGREREREEGGGEADADGAGSRRTSPTPAAKTAGKGKAPPGCGDARPTIPTTTATSPTHSLPAGVWEDTLGQGGGLRRLLQPYGLHALARCACPGVSPCDSTEDGDAPTTAAAAARMRWMECFALLHHQSRLTPAERVAVSRRALQLNGSVLPPVDFRATEEAPASLVLLFLWIFVETSVGRPHGDTSGVDASNTAAAAASLFLRCRAHLSVVLLALEWWSALLGQEQQACQTGAAEREESGGGGGSDTGAEVTEAASTSDPTLSSSSFLFLLDALLRLSPAAVAHLHVWLQHNLRAALLTPAKPIPNSAVDAAEKDEDVALLQAHVDTLLCIVLGGATAGDALPPVVSVDVFTILMQRVAALITALMGAATALTLTLCARVPRGAAVCDAAGASALRWAAAVLRQCTPHLGDRPAATAAAAPVLPPVWHMHVQRLRAALASASGSTDRDCSAWKSGDVVYDGEDQEVDTTSLVQTCGQLPCRVAVSALVQEWVTRVFAAHHPPAAATPQPSQSAR